MVIQLIAAKYLLIIIGIIFPIFIYHLHRNVISKNFVFPLVSGSVDDEEKLPDATAYPISDFHAKREYKFDGKTLTNFDDYKKFVNYGNSMVPVDIKCGDGILAEEFTEEQKESMKIKDILKEKDVIICNYVKDDTSIIKKARLFVSFIDLSLSINDLCKFAFDNASRVAKCQINEITITNFKNKLETKERLKKHFKDVNEKNKNAGDFMLSITYQNNELIDLSIHSIDELFGRVVYVIPQKNINSSVIIKEFLKKEKKDQKKKVA